MKSRKARYQQSSISKLPRASGGFVWKVRFSEHRNDKRHQRTLTFDGIQYPTERDVRAALETTVVRVNAGNDRSRVESLFGAIIEMKHLPSLEHSTKQTNAYLLGTYIEHRWWNTGILDVKPWQLAWPLEPDDFRNCQFIDGSSLLVNYLWITFMRPCKKIEDDPRNPQYLLTDAYVGYRFNGQQLES